MAPINYFNLVLVLGCFVSLVSGLAPYLRNPKRNVNKVWLRLNILSAIWSLGYAVMVTTGIKEIAWIANWVLHAAAIFIPVLYLHFVLSLTDNIKKYKPFLVFSYAFGAFLFLINPTKLFIQDVKPKLFFNYVCDAGPLYIVFALFFFLLALVANLILFKVMNSKTGIQRRQFEYVLFSSVIGFLGGGSVFLLTFNVPFAPYPLILYSAYPMVISYSIVRYRFMDMGSVVLRSAIFGTGLLAATFLYATVSSLFSVYLSQFFNTNTDFVAGLIFSAMIVAGYTPIYRFLERITHKFLYRKRYDPDKILIKINEATSSILKMGELIETIAKILTDALGCGKFSILSFDQKDDKLEMLFEEGVEAELARSLAGHKDVIKILQAELKRVKGILVIDEIKTQYENKEITPASPELLYKLDEAGIALIVPLYVKGNLVGIMVLGNKKSGSLYNSQDLGFLSIISGQVAAAVENARLYDQLKDFNATLQERVDSQTKEIKEAYEKTKSLMVQDEALLSSLGDGVVAVDKGGKIMFMNDAAGHMLLLQPKQVENKPYEQVLNIAHENGDVVAKQERPFYQAIFQGKKTSTDVTAGSATLYYERSDKTKFPVAVTVSPVVLDGQTIGAVEVFRDITIERQLDKSKTEFVSLASHQLRTPLSAIKWYSEIILGGKAGKLLPKQKKYLNEVHHGNERMIKLVNSMLVISRLEAGRIKINPVEVDFEKLIKEIVKEQQFTIDKKKQKFTFKIEGDIPKSVVDADLSRMIFQNLTSNAIKYTPEKGKITCKMKSDGQKIYFEVEDTGIGIPEAQQGRVFEKLFRADNAFPHDPEGNGLGLYGAKAAAENLGGKIWFKSKENEGTTFFVVLPVVVLPVVK